MLYWHHPHKRKFWMNKMKNTWHSNAFISFIKQFYNIKAWLHSEKNYCILVFLHSYISPYTSHASQMHHLFHFFFFLIHNVPNPICWIITATEESTALSFWNLQSTYKSSPQKIGLQPVQTVKSSKWWLPLWGLKKTVLPHNQYQQQQ